MTQRLSWRYGLVVAAVIAMSAPPLVSESNAAIVVCRRKNRIKLRPDVCKGKETQVNPAELGVVSSPLIVPAAAFSDDGFVPDSFFFSFGGGSQQGNAGNYGCVKAAADLPIGATITAARWFVIDNDGAQDIFAGLRRVNIHTGDTGTLSSVQTTGADPMIQEVVDDTIDDPVVEAGYGYYLTTCTLGSNETLLGAEIDFAVTSP